MVDRAITHHRAQRQLATASLALPMLMASMDTSIANVALPALAHAFGASFAQVQWVVVGYLLSLTSSIVGAGRLGDIVGRRRLLSFGLGLLCFTSLLCSLSITLSMLVAARALQGLGAAVVISMTMALVGETVPASRVARTMGLLGTMSALGTSLGPSLGGMLIEAFGWRACFIANLPLGIVAITLVRRRPASPAASQSGRQAFDVAGLLVLAAGLSALALATTGRKPVFLAIAMAALVVFVWAERRAPSPLVRLSMLRDLRLSAGLVTSLLIAAVLMATLVVGPFYLGRALGLGAAGVGLAMATGPLAAAITGFPAGRVVERLGSLRVALIAVAGVAAGLALAAISAGLTTYLAAIVIVTVSYATFQAANNSTVMNLASPDERGLVAGLLSLSRNLGLILGAGGMGALFDAASGGASMGGPTAIATAMRVTFGLAALLAATALTIAAGSAFAQMRPTALGRFLAFKSGRSMRLP